VSCLLVAPVTNLTQPVTLEWLAWTKTWFERTLGMGSWPLKRRLTLLSIPLGFLHASFTPW
jgi:hypothetical protein